MDCRPNVSYLWLPRQPATASGATTPGFSGPFPSQCVVAAHADTGVPFCSWQLGSFSSGCQPVVRVITSWSVRVAAHDLFYSISPPQQKLTRYPPVTAGLIPHKGSQRKSELTLPTLVQYRYVHGSVLRKGHLRCQHGGLRDSAGGAEHETKEQQNWRFEFPSSLSLKGLCLEGTFKERKTFKQCVSRKPSQQRSRGFRWPDNGLEGRRC